MLILFLLKSNNSLPLIFVTSTSSILTVPEVGSINLEIHLTKVDFPLPDKPITTNVSPFSIEKLTSFTATTCPVFS